MLEILLASLMIIFTVLIIAFVFWYNKDAKYFGIYLKLCAVFVVCLPAAAVVPNYAAGKETGLFRITFIVYAVISAVIITYLIYIKSLRLK